MNLPTDSNPEKDTLKALFEAREAQFQENLYKGWAMAERDATYDAIKEIAITLIMNGKNIAVIDNDLLTGAYADSVVKAAIAIHEQIRDYSDKQKQELTSLAICKLCAKHVIKEKALAFCNFYSIALLM